jgi:hypothetical protein
MLAVGVPFFPTFWPTWDHFRVVRPDRHRPLLPHEPEMDETECSPGFCDIRRRQPVSVSDEQAAWEGRLDAKVRLAVNPDPSVNPDLEVTKPARRCAGRAMLLCLSSRHGWVLEEAVEAAGEVALEAAGCFAAGFALADSALDVVDRWAVCSFPCEQDEVECSVQFPVAAAIEAVADRLAG